jgi:hypothetical protein
MNARSLWRAIMRLVAITIEAKAIRLRMWARHHGFLIDTRHRQEVDRLRWEALAREAYRIIDDTESE